MPHNATSLKTLEQPVPKQAVLPIYAVTPFTMLDFPHKTACIVWFAGCNMRCPYCHNPQIVRGKGRGDVAAVMAFLKKRQGLLDGVVLSGGEATSYSALPDFIRTLKSLGYAIKLDTNGLRPSVIAALLNAKLLDYIALDYKSPPEKFKMVTGVNTFDAFSKTLGLLCAQKDVPFEIRTTVHTNLLDETDITNIINDLDRRNYRGTYFVQNFTSTSSGLTLGVLPSQARILKYSKLPSPQNFSLSFRNF